MLGGLGECEVFSFHATKFFNTFEGGAIVTANGVLAEKMRLMRNFGFAGYDNVIYSGTNGKMTEMAAAMGLTNLEDLDSFVAINRRNYDLYRCGIEEIKGLSLLKYDESETNNFQYIVAEVGSEYPLSRDAIVEALHAEHQTRRRTCRRAPQRIDDKRGPYSCHRCNTEAARRGKAGILEAVRPHAATACVAIFVRR